MRMKYCKREQARIGLDVLGGVGNVFSDMWFQRLDLICY
jgi:hypothetical protein